MVVSSNTLLLPLAAGNGGGEDRTADVRGNASQSAETRKPFADTLGDALQTRQADSKPPVAQKDEPAPQEKPDAPQNAALHEPEDSAKPTNDQPNKDETQANHKEKPAPQAITTVAVTPVVIAVVAVAAVPVVANAPVTPTPAATPPVTTVVPSQGESGKAKAEPGAGPKAQSTGTVQATAQGASAADTIPYALHPAPYTLSAAIPAAQTSPQAPAPPQTVPGVTAQAVVTANLPGNPMDSRPVAEPTRPGLAIANLNPPTLAVHNAPQAVTENRPVAVVANAAPTPAPPAPTLTQATQILPQETPVVTVAPAPQSAKQVVIKQAAPEQSAGLQRQEARQASAAEPAAQATAQAADETSNTPNITPVIPAPDALQTQAHLERLRTVGVPETPLKTPEAHVTPAATEAKPAEVAPPTPQTARQSAPQTASVPAPNTQHLTPNTLSAAPLTSPFEAIDTMQAETFSGVAVVGNAGRTVENSGEAARPVASQSFVSTAAGAAVREAATAGGANADTQGERRESNERGEPSGPTAITAAAKPNGAISANGVPTGSASGEVEAASSTAANAPIDRTKLMAQVTQHLETLRFAEGRGEVAFRLNPEHLGSLHISVSTHADGVTARVIAEHAGVRQVMEEAREHLKSALESRGLHLDKLEISVGNATLADGRASSNASAHQQQQAFQERSNSGRGASRPNRAIETPVEALAAPIASAVKSQSRLDYRA